MPYTTRPIPVQVDVIAHVLDQMTADGEVIDWWGRVASRMPRGSGFVSTPIDRAAIARTRAEFPALANRVLHC